MDDQELVTAVGRDEGLTRMTVNLTADSYGALLEAEKITEESRADVVNRALRFYAFLAKQEKDGWAAALLRGAEVRQVSID